MAEIATWAFVLTFLKWCFFLGILVLTALMAILVTAFCYSFVIGLIKGLSYKIKRKKRGDTW
jgi:hypothetical protein